MPNAKEEFRIFVERFAHFRNLETINKDLNDGHYIPSLDPLDEPLTVSTSVLFVVFAYFYSLIEDDDESINAFRLWRARYPEEEPAIMAVEAKVAPFRQHLKWFRNRMGFHGSRSRAHEAKGMEFFRHHKQKDVALAIEHFRELGAALLAKDLIARGKGRITAEQLRAWIDSIAAGDPKMPEITQTVHG